jgi:L-rhamnose mutarotase
LDQSGIAELSDLASDSIEIPVEFMNSFRAGVFPEQYTLEDRKMEEDEYFNVTCAEDQNYFRFRHNAIRASNCEPLQIKYDMNDTVKEFLIDHSMASDYSDHHKKWKNSQLLHSYIEMLIANKMVMALSSKPVNKRWVRLMRRILLDYLDSMQANTKLQINFTLIVDFT